MHIKARIDISTFSGSIIVVPAQENTEFIAYLYRQAYRSQVNRSSKSGRKAKSPFFVRGQGVVPGHPKGK